QLRGTGTFKERQVFGTGAIVHVGWRRERADLKGERRDAAVRDPRVVDARRTFGTRAAQFQQQAIVEVACDGALHAETRATEIESVAEIARGGVLAIGHATHRAPTEIGGEGTCRRFAIESVI